MVFYIMYLDLIHFSIPSHLPSALETPKIKQNLRKKGKKVKKEKN